MCNLSPKQAGKMIGSFAGITALFSLIVIIIGSATLQFQIDAAIFQTCGNSGAYKTDCSVEDWEATSWRRLATKAMSDKPTERNLAGSEAVHPATPNLWFDALFDYKTVGAKMSKVAENIVKRNFASKNKKKQPTRLLASHGAKNTDECATAKNRRCEDDQKKAYVDYGGYGMGSGETCALNTDTTDCNGILATSKCVKGECCCSKDAVAAVTVTDFLSMATYTYVKLSDTNCKAGECCCQKTDGSGDLSFTGSYFPMSVTGSCSYSKCLTEFPNDCENYGDCKSDKVDDDTVGVAAWSKSYKSDIEDATGENDYTFDSDTMEMTDSPKYESCGACETKNSVHCNNALNGGYGETCDAKFIDSDWDEPPFVEASCYSRKGDMCEGGENMDQQVKEYLAIFRQYVTYAGIAAIVGVLPALAAAAGKMNNHNSMGNCCGVLSLPSTFLLSMGATFGIAFYLVLVGGYITLACQQTETSFMEYEVSPECNAECLAAQKHYVGAICDIGSAAGTTGMLMFLVAVLGFLTTIMVCVGFCSNKKQQTAVQGVVVQQVPMQQILPVQQGEIVSK